MTTGHVTLAADPELTADQGAVLSLLNDWASSTASLARETGRAREAVATDVRRLEAYGLAARDGRDGTGAVVWKITGKGVKHHYRGRGLRV